MVTDKSWKAEAQLAFEVYYFYACYIVMLTSGSLTFLSGNVWV